MLSKRLWRSRYIVASGASRRSSRQVWSRVLLWYKKALLGLRLCGGVEQWVNIDYAISSCRYGTAVLPKVLSTTVRSFTGSRRPQHCSSLIHCVQARVSILHVIIRPRRQRRTWLDCTWSEPSSYMKRLSPRFSSWNGCQHSSSLCSVYCYSK